MILPYKTHNSTRNFKKNWDKGLKNPLHSVDAQVVRIHRGLGGGSRGELSIKNEQPEILQGEATRLGAITPPDRALQLAQQIPEDAGPYALALKAIAEKRFDDARFLLDKAPDLVPENIEIVREAGLVYLNNARYNMAEPLMRRALGILEQSLGPDHPKTKTVRRNLESLK